MIYFTLRFSGERTIESLGGYSLTSLEQLEKCCIINVNGTYHKIREYEIAILKLQIAYLKPIFSLFAKSFRFLGPANIN